MTCFQPLSKKSVPVLCVLAGILCLSIAPVASGFMSLQQQNGNDGNPKLTPIG